MVTQNHQQDLKVVLKVIRSNNEATTMSSEVSEENITAAADAFDKSNSTATSATTTSSDDGEPTSVKTMISQMNKYSDGTNVIKETIKTFSNPFGSDKKGDVILNDKGAALEKLKEMVNEDRSKHKETSKKFKRWDFRTSPHEIFGKTLDDTFAAYIQWALVGSDDEDSKVEEESYNVSKAFRRLANYADWMDETGEDLVSEPLTAASVQEALKAWAMRSTIDKNGYFAWWIDMQQVDKVAVKTTVTPTESLRAFVWYSHFVMYNENAQQNGFIFVERVGSIGFIESMTFVPMKLGVKLDRLTIGVLPIKMKKCYVMEVPKWMDLFFSFMGMFMSKKMKSRIVMLKEYGELEEIVGKECIPAPFGELEGRVEKDLVDSQYYS